MEELASLSVNEEDEDCTDIKIKEEPISSDYTADSHLTPCI